MRKIKIDAKYSYYIIKEQYNWNYDHWHFKTYFYKKKYELTIFNKTIFTIKKLTAIRFFGEMEDVLEACVKDIQNVSLNVVVADYNKKI